MESQINCVTWTNRYKEDACNSGASGVLLPFNLNANDPRLVPVVVMVANILIGGLLVS